MNAPFEELTAAYLTLHKASGIEVGDKVKVIRLPESLEMGWNKNIIDRNTRYIGEIFVVKSDDKNGGFEFYTDISATGIIFFPFFCLELVKKGKKEFSKTEEGRILDLVNGISEGQTITFTRKDGGIMLLPHGPAPMQSSKPELKIWKPKKKEYFYYTDWYFDTCKGFYIGDKETENLFDALNCFETEEEARKVSYYLKAVLKLYHIAKQMNGDWIPKENEDAYSLKEIYFKGYNELQQATTLLTPADIAALKGIQQ